jgi:hypothetical protein
METEVKSTASAWDATTRTLRTELRGAVAGADVESWRQGLHREVARIPANSGFKLLLDLRGFEPVDLDAHKAMRKVVPELLIGHGMRPAFLGLFDDAPEVAVTTENGVVVQAFANVHHDETKMGDYERRIGTDTQRFLTDREAAEAWLAGIG